MAKQISEPTALMDESAFSRTVNAVDDLGVDDTGNTPVDTTIENELDTDGTLIVFPDGKYLFEDMWKVGVTNVGLVAADGANPTIVTPDRGSVEENVCINLKGGGIKIEGFTYDYTNRGDNGGPTTLVLGETGDVYLNDLQFNGYVYDKPISVAVQDSNSVGLVENVHVPDGSQDNTSTVGLLVNQVNHNGELGVRDSTFNHCTSGGIYASPNGVSGDTGPVIIDGCYFRNNNTANIRIGGTGDAVQNCVMVQNSDVRSVNVIWDNANPERDQSIHAPRQMQFRDGGVAGDTIPVENCTFVLTDPLISTLSSSLHTRGDYSGGAAFKDCKVVHNHNNSPVFDSSNTGASFTFDNCSVVGDGCGNANGAFENITRDGFTFTDGYIDMPNAPAGVYLDDVDNYSVTNSSIIAGTRVSTTNSTGTTSNLDSVSEPTVENVEHYGAWGDGSKDDRGLILEAANVAAENGTVYFPNGTYLISTEIEYEETWDDLKWQGESYSDTEILLEGAQTGVHFGFRANFSGAGEGSVSTITFDNIAINGQGLNQNYDIGLGLKVEQNSLDGNVVMRDTIVRHWATNGLEIEDGSLDINRCEFNSCGDGTYQYNNGGAAGHGLVVDSGSAENETAVIKNSLFANNQGAAIDTNGGSTLVDSCIIYADGVGGKEFSAGIKQNVATDSLTVRNTHMYDFNRMGIKEDSGESGDAGILELDNVRIENCGYPAIDLPVSVTLRGDKLSINNADESGLRPNGGAGIYIDPDSTGSADANINSFGDMSIYNVGSGDDGLALSFSSVNGNIDELSYSGSSVGNTSGVSIGTTIQDGGEISPTLPTESQVGAGSSGTAGDGGGDTNERPSASAGTDDTVAEETVVTLDATGSSDPDGDALSYSWQQTAGPTVSLTDQNTATADFTAPEVDGSTELIFEVTVSDGSLSDTSSVTITVSDTDQTFEDGFGVSGFGTGGYGDGDGGDGGTTDPDAPEEGYGSGGYGEGPYGDVTSDVVDVDRNVLWETTADWDTSQSETGVHHEKPANTDWAQSDIVEKGHIPNEKGLDLYLPLDENSGSTANDISGNGLHGDVIGATQGQGGSLSTSAYQFDGTTDSRVEIPSDPQLSPDGALTFAIEAKAASGATPNGEGSQIAGKARGTDVEYGFIWEANTQQVIFRITDANGNSAEVKTPQSWGPSDGATQFIGRYDGSELTITRDGNDVATANASLSVTNSGEKFFVGSNPNGGAQASLVTNGLVTQHEADSGVSTTNGTVTGWTDQQGNNDMTANGDPQFVSTIFDGVGGIRFDGDDDDLENLSPTALPTSGADRTMFMIASYRSGLFGGAAYGDSVNNEAFGLVVDDSDYLTVQLYGGSYDVVSDTIGVGEGELLQEAVLDGSTLTHYKGGTQIDSASVSPNTANNLIKYGAELTPSPYVDMDLGAVLIYDRALSTSEREEVEDYLSQKYLGETGSVGFEGTVDEVQLWSNTELGDVATTDLYQTVGGQSELFTSVKPAVGSNPTLTTDTTVPTDTSVEVTVYEDVEQDGGNLQDTIGNNYDNKYTVLLDGGTETFDIGAEFAGGATASDYWCRVRLINESNSFNASPSVNSIELQFQEDIQTTDALDLYNINDERNISEAEQQWDEPITFSESSNMHTLVEALLEGADQVDASLEGIYDAQHIAGAEGEDLNRLGEFVNVDREFGEPDERYRTRIKAAFRSATIGTTTDEFMEFCVVVLDTDEQNLEFQTSVSTSGPTVSIFADSSVWDDLTLTVDETAEILDDGVPAGHEVLIQESGTFVLLADGDVNDPDKGLTSDSIETGGTLASDVI